MLRSAGRPFDFAHGRLGGLSPLGYGGRGAAVAADEGVRPSMNRGHAGLPVAQVGGEVVYREGGGLFVGPVVGDGPEHVRRRSGFFGEGGPLGVAHDAPTGGFFDAGKFAAGDQGRKRSAWVAAFGGHQVGEVHTASVYSDNRLSGLCDGVGSVLDFEAIETGEAGDDEGFHGGKSSRATTLQKSSLASTKRGRRPQFRRCPRKNHSVMPTR